MGRFRKCPVDNLSMARDGGKKSYFFLLFAMRIMAATLRSTSSSVVAQLETEMRMAV